MDVIHQEEQTPERLQVLPARTTGCEVRVQSLAKQLCRPELRELVPYASARREASGGRIWLNANESPWNNTDIKGINRYPDCQPPALRQCYARYAKLNPEQLLITRGADEGIELLIRTFCVPGKDKIVSLTPTYGMYKISAQTCGVDYQDIPWQAGYTLPAELTEAGQSAKLVFLCNPNNPTGTLIEKSQLLELVQSLPETLVVIDEAYIDFCPEQTLAGELSRCPNLVILRTLSKAFALAGARCGFVLANCDVIAMLEKVIEPYPVPVPVCNVAEAALSPGGIARMVDQTTQLNGLRHTLVNALKQLNYVEQVEESAANFVLFKVRHANLVYQALAERGILLRVYSALPGWLRISIGNQQEMCELMEALTGLETG